MPDFLATAMTQVKEVKYTYIRREEIELFLFVDDCLSKNPEKYIIKIKTHSTNKWVHQVCKIQDKHTEINCISMY